jgi:hypothetical protein
VLGRSVLGFVGASSRQPAVKWQTAAESGRRQLKVLDRSNKTRREGAADGFVAAGSPQPAGGLLLPAALTAIISHASSAGPVSARLTVLDDSVLGWQCSTGQCSAGSRVIATSSSARPVSARLAVLDESVLGWQCSTGQCSAGSWVIATSSTDGNNITCQQC